MSAQGNQWRVSTIEGIFETDLDTLKQWIVEGCVLPTDKVSKGQLSWIDAGKAPMLRAAFNGEYVPATPPPVAPVPESVPVIADSPAENVYSTTSLTLTLSQREREPRAPEPEFQDSGVDDHGSATQDFTAQQLGKACHNHPDASPKFICRVCATPFCEECPRYIGTTNIPVCPLCGDMCKPFEELHKQIQRMNFQDSGFGISDFGRALAYPLNHKMALVFGAAVYGFLQLGGYKGRVIAFVIMFGCISHVISQVAWGRLHRSFLPDFSAFSLWDDLAVPIGLGIGITIVTWGPAIALTLAIIFGVIGPKLQAAPDRAAAKPQVAGLTPEDLDALTNPEADPKKLEEANAKLTGGRPDVIIAKEAKASQEKLNDPTADIKALAKYSALPVILVVLFLGCVAWGIFYGPMALAVAGYTENFGSVINPMVGLDTIRRMGGTYFKAFGMVLLLQIVGMIVGVIVAIITAPFAMPFVGNLPASFIDGAITFYFNLVIACVLGLSIHKSADRLGIELN